MYYYQPELAANFIGLEKPRLAAYLEKTTRSSFRQSVADDDDGVAGPATLLASILAPGLWMTLQGRRGDD